MQRRLVGAEGAQIRTADFTSQRVMNPPPLFTPSQMSLAGGGGGDVVDDSPLGPPLTFVDGSGTSTGDTAGQTANPTAVPVTPLPPAALATPSRLAPATARSFRSPKPGAFRSYSQREAAAADATSAPQPTTPAAEVPAAITIVREPRFDGGGLLGDGAKVKALQTVVSAPAYRKSCCMRVLAAAVWVVLVAVVVLAALMMWQLIAWRSEPHVIAWASAGIIVALCLPIGLYDIQLHLSQYVSPLQRHYVRIVLMPLV